MTFRQLRPLRVPSHEYARFSEVCQRHLRRPSPSRLRRPPWARCCPWRDYSGAEHVLVYTTYAYVQIMADLLTDAGSALGVRGPGR